jgi:predicted nucleotidyltransferase
MLSTDIARRPAEVAREAARLAKKILGESVEVIWFGSWPQGKARPHSDIDLAVRADRAITPERLAVLRDAVDNLQTLYEVELVDLATVGPSMRKTILGQGVRL